MYSLKGKVQTEKPHTAIHKANIYGPRNIHIYIHTYIHIHETWVNTYSRQGRKLNRLAR